jgi:hypothetical protein
MLGARLWRPISAAPAATWLAAVFLLTLTLEFQEGKPDPLFVVFFLPALAAGLLVGDAWRTTLALLAIPLFAIVDRPPDWDVVTPAVLFGAAIGLIVHRVVARTAGEPATARQTGALVLRAQQAIAFPPVLRRLRIVVDDALDLLRLRLDTFPHGLYQPVPGIPVRAAKRAAGTEARWAAMEQIVERLGVETAMDVGANAGYYPIRLAQRGIATVALDSNPRCVRLMTTAVRRNRLDNVAVLAMELRPDTIGLLPTTDCTILLSVWHHVVRYQGLEAATQLLRELWARTGKVLFFDTGEDEMPEDFGLPPFVPTPQAWLTDYLQRNCEGGRTEHFGRHPAFDVEGRPVDRSLFAVIRDSAQASQVS